MQYKEPTTQTRGQIQSEVQPQKLDAMRDKLGDAKEKARDTMAEAKTKARGTIEGAKTKARETIGDAKSMARKTMDQAKDTFGDARQKVNDLKAEAKTKLSHISDRIPAQMERVRAFAPKLGFFGAGLAAGVGIGLVAYRSIEGRFPWQDASGTQSTSSAQSKRSSSSRSQSRQRGSARKTTGGESQKELPSLSLDGLKKDANAAKSLDAHSKEELYELARKADVPGRSGMSKKKLVSALTNWREQHLN